MTSILATLTASTAAERDALPAGTVVRSASGTIAGRFDATVGVVLGDERPFSWTDLELPLTILHHPELDVPEITRAARAATASSAVRAAADRVAAWPDDAAVPVGAVRALLEEFADDIEREGAGRD